MQTPKGEEVQCQCLLDIVLKSDEICSHSHIPMHLVSKQSKFLGSSTQFKVTKVIRQHCQLQNSITDITVDTINEIDTLLVHYDSRTLWHLMMHIARPDNLTGYAILAIDSKGT